MEQQANEAVIAMVVGLRKSWKMAVGYFLVNGTPSSLVKIIIQESIIRAFKSGLVVVTVVADGAKCNISAFNSLGAIMHPEDPAQMRASFPHPLKNN